MKKYNPFLFVPLLFLVIVAAYASTKAQYTTYIWYYNNAQHCVSIEVDYHCPPGPPTCFIMTTEGLKQAYLQRIEIEEGKYECDVTLHEDD